MLSLVGTRPARECKHCGEKFTILGTECQVCKNAMFRYKMNRNDIIQLHKSQGGKCVLCQCDIEMFCGHKGGQVDHDHETGRVRGILCLKCNVAVGSLENRRVDNITLMLHYIGYLKEPEQSIA